jgi:hypothetical protein
MHREEVFDLPRKNKRGLLLSQRAIDRNDDLRVVLRERRTLLRFGVTRKGGTYFRLYYFSSEAQYSHLVNRRKIFNNRKSNNRRFTQGFAVFDLGVFLSHLRRNTLASTPK